MVLGRQDVLAWALGHLFSCSAHTLPFQLWFPSVLSLHPCECSWLAHSCSCQPSFIFGRTSVKHSICLIWESSSVLKDQVVCCWSWFLSPLTLAQLRHAAGIWHALEDTRKCVLCHPYLCSSLSLDVFYLTAGKVYHYTELLLFKLCWEYLSFRLCVVMILLNIISSQSFFLGHLPIPIF